MEMITDTITDYLVRSPSEKNTVKLLRRLMREEEGKVPKGEAYIYCRQCYKVITRPDERIVVHGSHHHTFANPHGLVFEIACFRTAEGCGYTGQPTTEFTWFTGYSWRIAICSKCLAHVGWLFASSVNESFNGLIIDRLIYPK